MTVVIGGSGVEDCAGGGAAVPLFLCGRGVGVGVGAGVGVGVAVVAACTSELGVSDCGGGCDWTGGAATAAWLDAGADDWGGDDCGGGGAGADVQNGATGTG